MNLDVKEKILMKFLKRHIYITYTLIFAIAFFFATILWHLIEGKSLIADYDSIDQHFIGFLYVGQWIRDLVSSIFTGGGIDFRMWDFAIGYGSDVFATMAVYFGDPFYWLSAFIKPQHAEIAYEVVIIAKIYLCGITFSYFSLQRGNDKKASLIGALVYAFAGSVYVGFLQTIFLSAMYLFPLVMLGVCRLWEERRWGLYVFSLFLTFMTYFYFAYMVCLLILGYCIVRLFTDESFDKNGKAIVKKVIDYAVPTILAVGCSALFILPAIMQLSGAGRLQTDYYLPILYDKGRYADFFTRFFDINWSGPDCYIGISAIAAPCIIFLFLKKGNRTLKCSFIILTIGLLLPYFGWMMNGFGYVTNRWSFAYSFCLSCIVVKMLPQLREVDEKKKLLPILFGLGYVIIVLGIFGKRDLESALVLIMVILACALAAGATFISEKQFLATAAIITVISASLNGMFFWTFPSGNWISHELFNGEALSLVENSSALRILSDDQQKAIVRFDKKDVTYLKNACWYQGVNGMDFYASNYNNNVDTFHNNIALLTFPWAYVYEGLNSRSELESLFGVSNYIVRDGYEMQRPYGFDEVVAEGVLDNVYKAFASDKKASLMHLFDTVISQDYYESLSPIQRQQVLMKGIVCDEEDLPLAASNSETNSGVNTISAIESEIGNEFDASCFDEKRLDYEIENNPAIESTDRGVYVYYPGESMILDIPDITDEEIYVWIKNLHYTYGDSSSYRIDLFGMSGGADAKGIRSVVDGFNNKNHMYGGKDNWLVNLGRADKTIDKIKITFIGEGEYAFDEIAVFTRSEESILANIDSLVPTGDDLSMTSNRIEATVQAEDDSYLLLTVPYSKGWTMFIDGEKSDIFKADDAFIGAQIPKGTHTVILKYRTPGLLVGIVISLISLVTICVLLKKKRVIVI